MWRPEYETEPPRSLKLIGDILKAEAVVKEKRCAAGSVTRMHMHGEHGEHGRHFQTRESLPLRLLFLDKIQVDCVHNIRAHFYVKSFMPVTINTCAQNPRQRRPSLKTCSQNVPQVGLSTLKILSSHNSHLTSTRAQRNSGRAHEKQKPLYTVHSSKPCGIHKLECGR